MDLLPLFLLSDRRGLLVNSQPGYPTFNRVLQSQAGQRRSGSDRRYLPSRDDHQELGGEEERHGGMGAAARVAGGEVSEAGLEGGGAMPTNAVTVGVLPQRLRCYR